MRIQVSGKAARSVHAAAMIGYQYLSDFELCAIVSAQVVGHGAGCSLEAILTVRNMGYRVR